MVSALSILLRRGIGHFKISPTVLVTRNYSDVRAWKPGPPPRTEEERKAAAAKYNLIPEDYQTWDEKDGYGDYPKFEGLAYDARDPFEEYDCEYERYYYGEPIHIDSILWGGTGDNPNFVTFKPIWYYYTVSLGTVLGFFLFTLLLSYYDVRVNTQTKPKQFPGANKKHYTFEPEYD